LIKYTPKIGARYFKWTLYKNATSYKSGINYKNSSHEAYYADGESSSQTITVPLSSGDDNQKYTCDVIAGNSFGESDPYTAPEITVPENGDPSTPWAITDLQATSDANSIYLNWTAPYDTDKSGVQAPCKEYNIRVSTEAIVDIPQNPFSASYTNPNQTTNWSNAKSVESFFSEVPAIPAPTTFEIKQSLQITPPTTNETYYFSIKAKDSDKWSYISNVAGVSIGSPEIAISPIVATSELKPYIFIKNTTLGINTFSVPFKTITAEGTSKEIVYLSDLITEINNKAGENIVQTLGWWDPLNMKHAGYEIVYGTGLNTISEYKKTTTAVPPTETLIIKDMPYQISVTKNVTFEVKGIR